MFRTSSAALLAVIILTVGSAANAATYLIGDNDGFGFGVADGASLPTFLFDNRSAGELASVDGSEFTDVTTGTSFPGIGPTPSFSVALSSPVRSFLFLAFSSSAATLDWADQHNQIFRCPVTVAVLSCPDSPVFSFVLIDIPCMLLEQV